MITIVYIPCSDFAEAERLASGLVSEKLIACANIQKEVLSVFPWEGKVDSSEEAILVGKTLPEKIKSINEWVRQNHSYDLPCVANWNSNANEDYVAWVKENTD